MNANGPQIDYQTDWLLNEAGARAHVTDVLQELQRHYAIADRDVIELGSGIGTNLQVFRAANRVRGVEGLAAAALEAQRRGIATQQGDLEAPIALPDAAADWILCIDVLEHLQRPAACLAQARRILRDSGRLVVNVPNHFDWRGRLRILLGSGIDSQRYFPDSPHWEYPHLRFFQQRSIGALLAASGFEVEGDYSARTTTIPMSRRLARLGLGGVLARLGSRWPDLLCAGFFLVCRKTPQAPSGEARSAPAHAP